MKLLKPRLTAMKPRLTTQAAATPRLRGRKAVTQRQQRLLRSHYMCEHCQAEGRMVMATVVDHIVPLAMGGPDTDDNTRNLCDDHHKAVTAKQFGR